MKKLILLAFITFLISCGQLSQPMAARKSAEEMERMEFVSLMKQDSINKQKNAAESLEVLLNDNSKNKKVSLIFNNNTNCNIILRFAGEKFYNLPIYKNDKNFIVIEKGTYSLGANLCNSRYSSTNTFMDSSTMTLLENK